MERLESHDYLSLNRINRDSTESMLLVEGISTFCHSLILIHVVYNIFHENCNQVRISVEIYLFLFRILF